MSFAWPLVLLLALVLVPLAARAVRRGLRRRDEELETFGEPAVLARGSTLGDAGSPGAAPGSSSRRSRWASSRSRARSSASARPSSRAPDATCCWCSISRAR